MSVKFTEEQLNNFDKAMLIQLFLNQQEQLESIDNKMQLLLEQMADMNRHRFGRSSEKSDESNQLSFTIEDGEIIFNEAEAFIDDYFEDNDEETITVTRKKSKGKKEEDIKGLPVEEIPHEMTEEELKSFFGDETWKRLPDEVYTRYKYTPASVSVEEHHVAVYSGSKSERMVKANHPKQLLRNSLASASTVAGVLNAKYVNAMPLYRIEAEYNRVGINISRQTMANWVIQCADRYLAVFYDYLHEHLYDYHVIQADETPCLVNKDGRDAGSKSYMWVYRTGKMYKDKPIVIYDYQRTRKSDHPREFLKDFKGICVTDGYQVYHSIEKERDDLTIAGCWAHARRRFDEALKATPKDKQKSCTANKALKMIQAIHREEKKLSDLSPTERYEHRQLTVKPLVEAYFAWVHKVEPSVLANSKTHKGLQYSINQEQYLKVFLDDGEVPMDNNSAEQSIRGFCIGKKNWVMIDTISGAKASAVAYSIAETAKANNLKPYEYFKYLLTVIPEHLDDTDRSFMDKLLPWSDELPSECRKPVK
ncbi:Transposase [Pseudobutyrivibrio sp. YE44]|uniref:IS66 family transposase n=1 Tax=Pseudobutyrivibrio sp. YE44 TaxID=1520802 RepID=UPI00088F495D|nr:IS66 family transposase [Pseudobutyrivibrio sp. YE44]SDB54823.1 Transposase [Pseudobutyrivibrio sp. YE44]